MGYTTATVWLWRQVDRPIGTISKEPESRKTSEAIARSRSREKETERERVEEVEGISRTTVTLTQSIETVLAECAPVSTPQVADV